MPICPYIPFPFQRAHGCIHGPPCWVSSFQTLCGVAERQWLVQGSSFCFKMNQNLSPCFPFHLPNWFILWSLWCGVACTKLFKGIFSYLWKTWWFKDGLLEMKSHNLRLMNQKLRLVCDEFQFVSLFLPIPSYSQSSSSLELLIHIKWSFKQRIFLIKTSIRTVQIVTDWDKPANLQGAVISFRVSLNVAEGGIQKKTLEAPILIRLAMLGEGNNTHLWLFLKSKAN